MEKKIALLTFKFICPNLIQREFLIYMVQGLFQKNPCCYKIYQKDLKELNVIVLREDPIFELFFFFLKSKISRSVVPIDTKLFASISEAKSICESAGFKLVKSLPEKYFFFHFKNPDVDVLGDFSPEKFDSFLKKLKTIFKKYKKPITFINYNFWGIYSAILKVSLDGGESYGFFEEVLSVFYEEEFSCIVKDIRIFINEKECDKFFWAFDLFLRTLHSVSER